jgi:hypothetical protein
MRGGGGKWEGGGERMLWGRDQQPAISLPPPLDCWATAVANGGQKWDLQRHGQAHLSGTAQLAEGLSFHVEAGAGGCGCLGGGGVKH